MTIIRTSRPAQPDNRLGVDTAFLRGGYILTERGAELRERAARANHIVATREVIDFTHTTATVHIAGEPVNADSVLKFQHASPVRGASVLIERLMQPSFWVSPLVVAVRRTV